MLVVVYRLTLMKESGTADCSVGPAALFVPVQYLSHFNVSPLLAGKFTTGTFLLLYPRTPPGLLSAYQSSMDWKASSGV